jgi:hypothetical protein
MHQPLEKSFSTEEFSSSIFFVNDAQNQNTWKAKIEGKFPIFSHEIFSLFLSL